MCFTLFKQSNDLDSSYKMALDFWDCFGREKKLVLQPKQEGPDGPGSLTWVSCEPRILKLTDFGVK